MKDNGDVQVTFLWTGGGGGITYTVTAYQRANVRSQPNTTGKILSYVSAGNNYPARCWVRGETITDNGITNDIWIKLSLNAGGFGYGYVSAVYLKGDKRANLPASASC